MPLNLTDEKSTLVQVMGWCRQATSHYLSQCWLRSMLPNGVTRPRWVKWDTQTYPEFGLWYMETAFLNSLRPGDIYVSVNCVIIHSGNGLAPNRWNKLNCLYGQLDPLEQISGKFESLKYKDFHSRKNIWLKKSSAKWVNLLWPNNAIYDLDLH